MQRDVIDGIPYWCDKEGRIYYYAPGSTATDSPKICLGTRDKLADNWEQLLAPVVEQYRLSLKPRDRKPTAAATPSK